VDTQLSHIEARKMFCNAEECVSLLTLPPQI